jgi:hypothetical protein
MVSNWKARAKRSWTKKRKRRCRYLIGRSIGRWTWLSTASNHTQQRGRGSGWAIGRWVSRVTWHGEVTIHTSGLHITGAHVERRRNDRTHRHVRSPLTWRVWSLFRGSRPLLDLTGCHVLVSLVTLSCVSTGTRLLQSNEWDFKWGRMAAIQWPDSGDLTRSSVRLGVSGRLAAAQWLYFIGGSINRWGSALRHLSWTFNILDILVSWANSLPLISLAWLRIQSEIEWFQVHLLE